jgi:16S rRNA (adenine1518-N6/adenine1519-N6)-dimethyltransferase
MSLQPLKRFGQNYLTDNNILNKIADEIKPIPGEKIVEIGPGKGALTEKLVERGGDILAVEIDKRVIDDLKAKFPTVEFIQGDFMEIDLKDLFRKSGRKIRIAGNIPYNITSPILFKLIENNEITDDAVLMVQLEVAQRMTGKRGTKDYGILSLIVNFFTEVEIKFKVSPNVFYPRPKVHSAVVHLKFKELHYTEEEKKKFIKIVKAAFGNRRKTLKNSLSNSIFKDIDFSESGINLSLRAEQLEQEDFIKLVRFVLEKERNR